MATVKVNINGIHELDFPSGVSSATTVDGVTTINLSGGGGGGVSGSGTTGFVPMWTGATALGDSLIDQGVTLANTLTISEMVSASVNGVINVQRYGAVCDGITDDHAAINAALLASPIIEFPAGCTCNLGTAGIQMAGTNTIIGNGATLLYTGTGAAISTGALGQSGYTVGLYIENLNINMTGSTGTPNGILFGDVTFNVSLSSVSITGGPSGYNVCEFSPISGGISGFTFDGFSTDGILNLSGTALLGIGQIYLRNTSGPNLIINYTDGVILDGVSIGNSAGPATLITIDNSTLIDARQLLLYGGGGTNGILFGPNVTVFNATIDWSQFDGVGGTPITGAPQGGVLIQNHATGPTTTVYNPLSAVSYEVGTNTAIPSTVTGYHGSGVGDVKVQLSDGTGTSGHVAAFDATGGLTDGGVPSGSGTVTSVALTVPARQTVTGSPVTTSGTLAISDNTQSANLVFGGPSSGSAAAPTFRALASADLPASDIVRTVGITIDGGGSVPSTGVKGYIVIPYGCTITGWTVIADQSGLASVDVNFIAGSGAPPTAPNIPADPANLISASAPVALTGPSQSAAGGASAISTWSTTLTQWGTLMFDLTSVTTCTRVTVQLLLQLS